MLQLCRINGINDPRNVKERSLGRLLENPRLLDVQPTRTNPNHGRAGLDSDHLVAFLVRIRQGATQCGHNIFCAEALVLPFVHSGIFQVEHHPRRARIQHLHHKLGVVRWPRHLIPLVLTPFRKLNPPAIPDRRPRIPVYRLFAGMGVFQRLAPFCD